LESLALATTKTTSPKKTTTPRLTRATTLPKKPRNAATTPAEAEAKKAPSKRARKTEKKLAVTRPPVAPLPRRGASPQAQEIALLAAQAALDKKALDVELLDVADKVDYADILVLMTGTSDRHVASLVQNVEEDLKRKKKLNALSVEGLPVANWVLVDFGDVVIHVFQESAREGYDIGRLWGSAARIPVPARANPDAPAGA
jgi:ribosome-associated protein